MKQKGGKFEMKKSVLKKHLSYSENRETSETRDEKMKVQKFIFYIDPFCNSKAFEGCTY